MAEKTLFARSDENVCRNEHFADYAAKVHGENWSATYYADRQKRGDGVCNTQSSSSSY